MSRGFSSRVEPWATATCWTSGESRDAGAYPAALWFADGTWDSLGASDESAHTRPESATQPAAESATAAPTAPALSLLDIRVVPPGNRRRHPADATGQDGRQGGLSPCDRSVIGRREAPVDKICSLRREVRSCDQRVIKRHRGRNRVAVRDYARSSDGTHHRPATHPPGGPGLGHGVPAGPRQPARGGGLAASRAGQSGADRRARLNALERTGRRSDRSRAGGLELPREGRRPAPVARGDRLHGPFLRCPAGARPTPGR